MASKTERSAPTEEIADFLDGFEGVIASLIDLAADVAGEDPEAQGSLELMAPPARAQFSKLRLLVEETVEASEADAISEAGRMLRFSAAPELFKAVDFGTNSVSKLKLPGGVILEGLGLVVQELKKILEALFPALTGENPPKWYAILDLVLDQLLNKILALISGFNGGDSNQVARELSLAERNSIAERGELRRAMADG